MNESPWKTLVQMFIDIVMYCFGSVKVRESLLLFLLFCHCQGLMILLLSTWHFQEFCFTICSSPYITPVQTIPCFNMFTFGSVKVHELQMLWSLFKKYVLYMSTLWSRITTYNERITLYMVYLNDYLCHIVLIWFSHFPECTKDNDMVL